MEPKLCALSVELFITTNQLKIRQMSNVRIIDSTEKSSDQRQIEPVKRRKTEQAIVPLTLSENGSPASSISETLPMVSELPTNVASDSVSLTLLPSGIPRIIHQIWFQGETDIPLEYKRYRDSLRQLHPTFVYMFWDETRIISLISYLAPTFYEIWKNLPFVIQKIDSAKIFILFQYGGTYVDLDMEAILSIEPLLTSYPLVFSRCYASWIAKLGGKALGLKHFASTQINNGFIACTPGHPVIARTVALLHTTARKKRHPVFQIYIAETCGTEVLARALHEVQQKHPDLVFVAYPPEYFEPKVKTKNKQPLITTDTRIIHHSYRNWAKNIPKSNTTLFIMFTTVACILCILCLVGAQLLQRSLDKLERAKISENLSSQIDFVDKQPSTLSDQASLISLTTNSFPDIGN